MVIIGVVEERKVERLCERLEKRDGRSFVGEVDGRF